MTVPNRVIITATEMGKTTQTETKSSHFFCEAVARAIYKAIGEAANLNLLLNSSENVEFWGYWVLALIFDTIWRNSLIS